MMRGSATARLASIAAWLASAAGAAGADPVADQAIAFNRDIRPILSDSCFHCHGPDSATRKADLRLDTKEGLYGTTGGGVVTPGRPHDSELLRRIAAEDPNDRMPPPDSGLALTSLQKDLLRRWIKQGADWQPHWSFIAPVRPILPPVRDSGWPRNAIDRFIAARLEAEGLEPAGRASAETLVRRVMLDLTGLPPTPQEVTAFLADGSPDAYERLVDRLLDSPRYGEHMATAWLDAARYGDTHGYSIDNARQMWHWRDWVIRAINADMPFDQFTIEQLAGDLLPGATFSQQLATGFNRNHLVNTEAGSIPEEFRVQYVVDRVSTTAMTWMGLTMQCAQCHDHKYDPITREDFYRFFAFFNTIDEQGLDGYQGNAQPVVRVPDARWEERLKALDRQIAAAESELDLQAASLRAGELRWTSQLAERGFSEPPHTLGLWRFDGDLDDSFTGTMGGQSWRGDAKFQDDAVLGQSLAIDSDRAVHVAQAGDIERDRPYAISFWIRPQFGGRFIMLSRLDESNSSRGWDLYCVNDRIYIRLIERWPDRAIRVFSEPVMTAGQWWHVAVSWDGSGRAAGLRLWLDGRELPLTVSHDSLRGSIRVDQPLVIGSRDSFFNVVGRFDQLRLLDGPLSDEDVQALATEPIAAGGSLDKSRDLFFAVGSSQETRELHHRLRALRVERDRHRAAAPTTMVMREQSSPRETFMLERGQYDQPGRPVTPGTPASLPPLPDDAPRNRLGLARWLVSGDHPLTSRVVVNHQWQLFFGEGLVRTPEDFGFQGRPPTHPQLLDWLATEFVRLGWDRKALHRLIVTSATYQQSAELTAPLAERDPDNALLARGPRMRLNAEMLRDQALAASGLLVEQLGGPPVFPYQPPGLWEELALDPLGERWTAQVYVPDHGDRLYRRSIYIFRKRSAILPTLDIFDAPNRETCTVRRTVTNTPLQALVVMNDPAYFEAARVLAQRILRSAPQTDARLRHGWRLLLSREPDDHELAVLRDMLERQRALYRQRSSEAHAVLRVGQAVPDPHLDRIELAAWMMVASALLNLHETLTRP